jgi:hypothetical protein
MAKSEPRYWERKETEEYEAQFDMLLARYSAEMLENCLLGVLWGISTKPTVFPALMGNIHTAKTEPYSSDVPTFRLMFNPEPDGTVLMLWIEESGDGVMEKFT